MVMKLNSNWRIFTAALVLPVVIAYTGTQIQHCLGWTSDSTVVFVLALCFGLWSAIRINIGQFWYKAIFMAAYFSVSLVGVFWVILFTSCVNGNCF